MVESGSAFSLFASASSKLILTTSVEKEKKELLVDVTTSVKPLIDVTTSEKPLEDVTTLVKPLVDAITK